MYRFSTRLESHAASSTLQHFNLDVLDIVSHQARALLAAINALSLVSKETAWITVLGSDRASSGGARVLAPQADGDNDDFAMEDAMDSGMIIYICTKHCYLNKEQVLATAPTLSGGRILSLLDLKKEYAIALAKLRISRRLPELSNSQSMLQSAESCVSMYVKCGLYQAAAGLCSLFQLDFSPLFRGLANAASSAAQSSELWNLAQEYLEQYDGPETGWKYHSEFLEGLYRVDGMASHVNAAASVPRWLVVQLKVCETGLL